MEMFTDTLGEHILGAIQVEIEQQLFEDWNNANLDEGEKYAEHKFMEFAEPSLQKSYNEFYNLTPDDEYYFEVE